MSEPYGLPPGTAINYRALGFPAWVDTLCRKWGLDSSTYPGHQEGDRPDIGAAPNPDHLNRGIDWAGPPDNMMRFAKWLISIAPERSSGYGPPGIEMVIHQSPITGERVWYPGWVNFDDDLPNHTDHVHTRHSASIDVPGPAPSVLTVPLVENPDGTWTSPSPAWAHLIMRESGGNPTIIQQIIDVNTGGNEAEGLFQITPATWRAHNGDEFAPNPRLATPQQQSIVAARIFSRNPSGSDWGAGLPGREDAAQLAAGLVPTAEGEDQTMAGVNVDGLNEVVDKLLHVWSSRSMFATSNDGVDDGVGMLLNADGNAWNVEMILGALLGVPHSVAQVQRTARGDFPPGSPVATDPWLRQIAQDFAVKLLPLCGISAVLPAAPPLPPAPTPTPEPADAGTSSVGPAGALGIIGTLVGVITWIADNPTLIKGIIGAGITILTALGVWKAPNQTKPKTQAKHELPAATPSTPATPAPTPIPEVAAPPASASAPAAPSVSGDVAHAAAAAAAAEIANLADLEAHEVDALRDRVKDTLQQ